MKNKEKKTGIKEKNELRRPKMDQSFFPLIPCNQNGKLLNLNPADNSLITSNI